MNLRPKARHPGVIRVGETGIRTFFPAFSDAIDIQIVIRDAPASGTSLSVPLLARRLRGTSRGARRTDQAS